MTAVLVTGPSSGPGHPDPEREWQLHVRAGGQLQWRRDVHVSRQRRNRQFQCGYRHDQCGRGQRRAQLHQGRRTRPWPRTLAPRRSNPWATAISAGPANESGQTVSLRRSPDNTNPGLFSAGPAVSPTGSADVHAGRERDRLGHDHLARSPTTAALPTAASTRARRRPSSSPSPRSTTRRSASDTSLTTAEDTVGSTRAGLHRRRRRHADLLRSSARPRQRHGRGRSAGQLHVHPGPELQRHRLVHLSAPTTATVNSNTATVDRHRHPGQRRAGLRRTPRSPRPRTPSAARAPVCTDVDGDTLTYCDRRPAAPTARPRSTWPATLHVHPGPELQRHRQLHLTRPPTGPSAVQLGHE